MRASQIFNRALKTLALENVCLQYLKAERFPILADKKLYARSSNAKPCIYIY
jgi:hypothetical protein